jgi:glutamate/tyrosine decarboxylase-like PLP-dependent enzyme
MDLVALQQVLPAAAAIGSIDPLDEILKLQSRYKFRIHIDTA